MENEQFIKGDEKEQSTNISKCPTCGAILNWSPKELCLMCEYCQTKVQIDMSRYGEELDFSRLLESNNTWTDETHIYRCNNCGAKEILNKNEIAKECSFCGTTNIVETEELSGLKPNAVLPFIVDKETACASVLAWKKKKFFMPKEFKRTTDFDNMKGKYNPAFTFDTTANARYYGRLGKYYYVDVKGSDGKVVSERRTEYIDIHGDCSRFFDDILVHASEAIPDNVLKKFSPYVTEQSKEYSEDYLHGYTATQYAKSGLDCWEEAKSHIQSQMRSEILSQYTYSFVDSLTVNIAYGGIKYKYVLLPFYIGHWTWKKKLYNFYVSGLNGKVTGKVPRALNKIAAFVGIIMGSALIIGLVGYLIKLIFKI